MVELGGCKEAGSSTTLCAVSNVPVELRKTSCVGSKRPSRCEGKENILAGDSEPPKKRGRSRKSIYSGHSCGDCTNW